MPAPSADHLQGYYPAGYHRPTRRYHRPLELALSALHERRVRSIEKACGRSRGSVLDIGCGNGTLLSFFRDHGWQVIGTELSETSAAQARSRHLDVRPQDVGQLGLPASSLDLIILWHVLEHLHLPDRTLREASRLLRPGGLLLVAVPNLASLEARITGRHWFHLDVPRHLHHFSAGTLRAALSQAGFDIVKTSHFAPEYDYFSFVQSILNALRIGHNILYDLLRAPGAQMLPASSSRSGRFRLVLATLVALPLAAISIVWVPAASILRSGGTVTMYARRIV